MAKVLKEKSVQYRWIVHTQVGIGMECGRKGNSVRGESTVPERGWLWY